MGWPNENTRKRGVAVCGEHCGVFENSQWRGGEYQFLLPSSLGGPLADAQAIWKEPKDWITETRGRGIVQCKLFDLTYQTHKLMNSRSLISSIIITYNPTRSDEIPPESRDRPPLFLAFRNTPLYTPRDPTEHLARIHLPPAPGGL